MKRLLLACLFLLLIASPAYAHANGYKPDADRDGYVEVYKPHQYNGAFHTYMLRANRQLESSVPGAPRMRMVESLSEAEVWVHPDPSLSACFGVALMYTDPARVDELRTSPYCDPGPRFFSHEMGHVYGLPWGRVGTDPPRVSHHRCTPYWQKRSVDVGETPGDGIRGCPVRLLGFGPDDLAGLREVY